MTNIIRFQSLYMAVFAIMFFVSCGGEEKIVEEIIRPVRYEQAFSTGGTRVRTFSGVAQAGVESRLSFKVAGTVQRVAVRVGDKVRTGQLIAELDPTDYQLQVDQASNVLESAKAQMRNADSKYDRVRQLYENRNASRNDLDAARSASESANAQVRAYEKQLELARSQLSYTKLTAPVDGAIATVDVETNENVQPGQIVIQLTSGSRLEVQVAIPEVLISQVHEGGKVKVVFDAISGKEFSAHITEVSIKSIGFATTFPVTVRLDHDDPDCRPGMAAEVAFTFESGRQRERIIVPSVAVGEDRLGKYVFVVKPLGDGFGTVHRRSVTIPSGGGFSGEGIEILDGLVDGELVVTAGVSRIQDGQKVKLPGYKKENA